MRRNPSAFAGLIISEQPNDLVLCYFKFSDGTEWFSGYVPSKSMSAINSIVKKRSKYMDGRSAVKSTLKDYYEYKKMYHSMFDFIIRGDGVGSAIQ